MALIGSITNWGEIQGQINDANGVLTGVISSAELLGGEIVGLRGLKGDKGDKGDTGNTGADGYSPSASVSKVGDTSTITITDKDGTTTAEVDDGKSPVIFDYDLDNPTTPSYTEIGSAIGSGKRCYVRVYRSSDVYGDETFLPLVKFSSEYYVFFSVTATIGTYSALIYNVSTMLPASYITGSLQQELVSGTNIKTINNTSLLGSGNIDIQGGGASAFVAEYGFTPYADVKDAYDEDAIIICTTDDSGNTVISQLAYFDDANDIFYFAQPQGEGWWYASIAIDDTWDDGLIQFAPTDTATQLRDGLMSALDKQKLDGIASGAEVNVQSDWNEADSTADDYIKNKPTIPTDFTGATSSSVGVHGLVPAPNSGGQDKVLSADGNWYNVKISEYLDLDNNDKGLCIALDDDSNATKHCYNFSFRSGITLLKASTSDYGFTKLSSSTSSTSTSLAATPSAVKAAYDEATDATATPTASKKSKFDSDAHMNSTDMTTGADSELEDFIDGLNVGGGSAFLDMFYPVGSYYETSDGTFDPNAKWGGTWTSETISDAVIVAAGTSNSWYYKKYSDGTFEAHINTSKTVAVNTSAGQLYTSAEQSITLPAIGQQAMNYGSVQYRGAEATWAKVNALTTSSFSFNFLTTVSRSSAQRYVTATIKGLWKTYATPSTIYRWYRTA